MEFQKKFKIFLFVFENISIFQNWSSNYWRITVAATMGAWSRTASEAFAHKRFMTMSARCGHSVRGKRFANGQTCGTHCCAIHFAIKLSPVPQYINQLPNSLLYYPYIYSILPFRVFMNSHPQILNCQTLIFSYPRRPSHNSLIISSSTLSIMKRSTIIDTRDTLFWKTFPTVIPYTIKHHSQFKL